MANKRVTICASASFSGEAKDWKERLEKVGYEVLRVPEPISCDREYEQVHRRHYQSIAESDFVFVMNPEKNGIDGYIGPSVFAEIAFALGLNVALGKKIQVYYLNDIPEGLPYSEELRRWKELGRIEKWPMAQSSDN